MSARPTTRAGRILPASSMTTRRQTPGIYQMPRRRRAQWEDRQCPAVDRCPGPFVTPADSHWSLVLVWDVTLSEMQTELIRPYCVLEANLTSAFERPSIESQNHRGIEFNVRAGRSKYSG